MTEALIGSLLLTALGGLSYMAVKHPRVYNGPLSTTIFIIGLLCLAAVELWNASNTQVVRLLLPYDECFPKVIEAVRARRVPSFFTWAALGLLGYSLFLNRVASWILKDQQQDKRH